MRSGGRRARPPPLSRAQRPPRKQLASGAGSWEPSSGGCVVANRAQVALESKPAKSAGLSLRPGKNLITGTAAFKNYFGAPTTLEDDLLRVASAAYAADVAFLRGEREKYPRTISLSVPVVNHAAFQAVRGDLEFCLG